MELIHIANATFPSLRNQIIFSLENLASNKKLFRIFKEQNDALLASPSQTTRQIA
jgi:hypothetical protein